MRSPWLLWWGFWIALIVIVVIEEVANDTTVVYEVLKEIYGE